MPIECKKNGDAFDASINSENFMCFNYDKKSQIGGEYIHKNLIDVDLFVMTCH
jgi:hypothetical protein